MIDNIKKYWPLIAVTGFLIAFSSRLQEVWGMPKAVEDLSKQLSDYVAANEAEDAQRDKWMELLTKKAMSENG